MPASYVNLMNGGNDAEQQWEKIRDFLSEVKFSPPVKNMEKSEANDSLMKVTFEKYFLRVMSGVQYADVKNHLDCFLGRNVFQKSIAFLNEKEKGAENAGLRIGDVNLELMKKRNATVMLNGKLMIQEIQDRALAWRTAVGLDAYVMRGEVDQTLVVSSGCLMLAERCLPKIGAARGGRGRSEFFDEILQKCITGRSLGLKVSDYLSYEDVSRTNEKGDFLIRGIYRSNELTKDEMKFIEEAVGEIKDNEDSERTKYRKQQFIRDLCFMWHMMLWKSENVEYGKMMMDLTWARAMLMKGKGNKVMARRMQGIYVREESEGKYTIPESIKTIFIGLPEEGVNELDCPFYLTKKTVVKIMKKALCFPMVVDKSSINAMSLPIPDEDYVYPRVFVTSNQEQIRMLKSYLDYLDNITYASSTGSVNKLTRLILLASTRVKPFENSHLKRNGVTKVATV